MAYNFNGSSKYLLYSPQLSEFSMPFTMACWFKTPTASSTTSRVLLEYGASGGGGGHRLVIPANQARLRANHYVTGNAQSADTPANSLLADTWMHGAAVFSSSTSRTVYLSNTTSAQNTQSVGSVGANVFTVGATANQIQIQLYFNGDIAEVGIWNEALSSVDIASLAAGISCQKVKTSSLSFYMPMIRDIAELFKARPITRIDIDNSSVSNHPRIYS